MLSKMVTEGQVPVDALAKRLRTSKEELAHTAGLTLDELAWGSPSSPAQRRLQEMVEILRRIEAWYHSPLMAYAWYRDVTLPGFAGMTAEMLVRDGAADAVMGYLDELSQGGYA